MKLRMRKPHGSILIYAVQRGARKALKRKQLKIGAFGSSAKSALGAGALPAGVSLDSITWKSRVLNREETLATISTTLAHTMLIVGFHLIDIERVIGMVEHIAHLLL